MPRDRLTGWAVCCFVRVLMCVECSGCVVVPLVGMVGVGGGMNAQQGSGGSSALGDTMIGGLLGWRACDSIFSSCAARAKNHAALHGVRASQPKPIYPHTTTTHTHHTYSAHPTTFPSPPRCSLISIEGSDAALAEQAALREAQATQRTQQCVESCRVDEIFADSKFLVGGMGWGGVGVGGSENWFVMCALRSSMGRGGQWRGWEKEIAGRTPSPTHPRGSSPLSLQTGESLVELVKAAMWAAGNVVQAVKTGENTDSAEVRVCMCVFLEGGSGAGAGSVRMYVHA